MRIRIACIAALSAACGGTAAAQVSVPLPRQGVSAPEDPDPGSEPQAAAARPDKVEAAAPEAAPVSRRLDINPYDRDIEMTVPLTYRSRPLGEIPVLLTHDDRFVVNTRAFLTLIDPLLNAEARTRIAAQLGQRDAFVPDDLGAIGITLEYDPGTLSVVVLRIAPEQRAMEALFDAPVPENEQPDLLPAGFSAFLNINAVQTQYWEGDTPLPSIFLNGAARIGRFVVEADIEAGEQGFTGSQDYGVERNFVRGVYDEPEQFRRWYLGDLSPEVRGQQGFVQLGGIGVSRQRRRFDQFRSSVLQGNRQLVVQRDSTVRVLRNGVLYRELRLEPGSYDLSSLPLVSGSNDVQIQVRDDAGRVQDISYRAYLDPIDLAPGDYEYAAYVGALSNRIGGTPDYGDEVAFTGFFRKAFLDAPSIGVGVQASAKTQLLTGQTQFVVGNGSRIQIDAGLSNNKRAGEGYSLGASYEQAFDRAGLIDTFTIRADYLSRRFTSLGNADPDNINAFSLSASYARAFDERLTILFDASYYKSRDNEPDRYRLGAVAAYRFSPKWSLRAGVDYSEFGSGSGARNGIGFGISLLFQPDYRQRAEARHDSNTRSTALSYSRSSDNRIGSVGYGGVLARETGSTSAQAYLDYTGNRFDASLNHASYGDGLSSITDQQVTSVRVGTALAFADGAFGVGRRINDSFAILYPHANLKGRRVVAGQSLAENDYMSKSGTLGGAVNGYLTSYVTQSIQYDVENPPAGYDVGAGVARVKPPYHSGYKLKIGTDAFVSATGTLLAPDGKPVSLAGGRVAALDGKDGAMLPFFTNSIGRFAIQNLRPGVRYRVILNQRPIAFEFTVPQDSDGLVDLEAVTGSTEPAGAP